MCHGSHVHCTDWIVPLVPSIRSDDLEYTGLSGSPVGATSYGIPCGGTESTRTQSGEPIFSIYLDVETIQSLLYGKGNEETRSLRLFLCVMGTRQGMTRQKETTRGDNKTVVLLLSSPKAYLHSPGSILTQGWEILLKEASSREKEKSLPTNFFIPALPHLFCNSENGKRLFVRWETTCWVFLLSSGDVCDMGKENPPATPRRLGVGGRVATRTWSDLCGTLCNIILGMSDTLLLVEPLCVILTVRQEKYGPFAF
mmetsp:Transcript_10807/g.25056  ORF Transcript_10807/g.25056 Transcript_10807/m.25056 type:complete len:255 (-) Transcript_10807:247-1011(-)